MIRRPLAVVLALVVVLAAVSAPASAALLGSAPTPSVQTYGGNPSYIVEFTNGSAGSIQDWANASEDRQLIELRNASTEAVVSAPRTHVLGRQLPVIAVTIKSPFREELVDRGYVEAIYLNYDLERFPPVEQPLSESEFTPPGQGLTALDDPDHPTEGLAFSGDVNATALNVSRNATGIDNVTAQGTGITVAVIDTGFNTADGQILGNGTANSSIRIDNASKNFITNQSVNTATGNYSAIEDGNGHGTWVASAIAANTSDDTYDGMAPNATVMVLKALADDGSGSTADIAAAIRHAADNDADIISMSLGSPIHSEPLVNAIEYAYDNGVQAITVAAGNSRPTRSPGIASPGDTPAVITVGATNGSEPAYAWSAYFSQVGPDSGATDLSDLESRGAGIDVAAPGFKITAKTAGTDGFTQNETLSGTSMATPIVAGVLAVALAGNSTLADANHTTIHDAVRNTSRPVPNAGVVEVGSGMVAADNLIDGTHPNTSQVESREDPAKGRDIYYRTVGQPEGWLKAVGRVGL